MNIMGIIIAMWRGFIDSLRGAVVLFSMDKQINEKLKKSPLKADSRRRESPMGHSQPKNPKHHRESKVLKRTIQCCALNGGMGMTVWSWTKPFLTITFSTMWVLPLFLLSRIVNSLWFQDIADSAYRYRQGRPMLLSSVSKLIADMLFSVLVQALFLGQGVLVSKMPLPPIGDVLALVHMCLLYALYAFEYKWFNMGWELHRRLTFIECNWPYFVGFGLPLALSTQLANSYVISGCVFSILFPLFIVSGNEAEPVTDVCDCPLKLFSPVVAIANTLFNKTIGPAKRR
ncbi:PREDICTED: etoposide-induced protein 2.4 isoform X3 [Ceratosolen solmsi marchali]|uniref:Etoposide-induced protein 2.4 isoform X3 n=1 Tax=Ceratosolen solmsi marchali TaxID=326594 RepID=A0AAJ6YBS4_9HYME|nr:PREDICTED: etoposide-induced protein 2.4 isoform X3 [Ceratosolen solmsi marchali]